MPVDRQNILVTYGGGGAGSPDWLARQADSVERYEDDTYEEDPTLATLFGGFIAVSLNPDDVVLDVGCGLWPTLPIYVRELNPTGYIGLEPLTTPVKRAFPCLVGAMAERTVFRDGMIDAILLATSIDHIEDVDTAMTEMKRILAPGGRIYLWVGLYDSELLAAEKTFHNLTHRGSWLKRIVRFALVNVEFTVLLLRMLDRKRRLGKGIPIDNVHFRYYTRKTITEDLAKWGLHAERELLVPGSSSLFIEARPIQPAV